jgi:glutamate N-acetyltransferase/amino-acid N-acetyltransferase
MLGIIATDAAISAPLLQQALGAANDTTFNQIVVDGDMSTNDSVVAFASGASHVEISEDFGFKTFQKALGAVCEALAKDIVRDGEGASVHHRALTGRRATSRPARWA